EARFLGRLLDALAALVEFPAVIEAADRVAFDGSRGKLRAAVRAIAVHQMQRAALTAVEREGLAHDAHRFRLAGRYVDAVVDRLPEAAQVAAGERSRPGAHDVVVSHRFPYCRHLIQLQTQVPDDLRV